MIKRVDVENLVIGSGAGGATAFDALVAEGKETLLIEEGRDRREFISTRAVPERMISLYRNAGIQPIFGRTPFVFAEGRLLGGTTELNGGLFWRTPEKVFDRWQTKHGFLSQFNTQQLENLWSELESDLSVKLETARPGFDQDSALLAEGAKKHNFLSVVVPRAGAQKCKRTNQCAAGCPIQRKQSMMQTLIPRAVERGGILRTESRVTRFNMRGKTIESISVLGPNGMEKILAKNFFLAAGAIGSVKLLATSRLPKLTQQIGFHLNAKVIAEFPERIDSSKGTILTEQVQELLPEGILIMPSSTSDEFLGVSAGGFAPERLRDLEERKQHLAIFTVQFKPSIFTRILTDGRFSSLIGSPHHNDYLLFKRGVEVASNLLFSAGAERLFLPFAGAPEARSANDVEAILHRSKKSDWVLSSVHAMASLPMGKTSRAELRTDGRHSFIDNLWVTDASALPELVGESPQGTIMAWSRAITHQVSHGA